MHNRIVGITIPFSILQSEDMVNFLKKSGLAVYLDYCKRASEMKDHSDEFVRSLLGNGYIVAVATSTEMIFSVKSYRSALIEHHKAFERLKLAKAYSSSFGYIVVLGKEINGVEHFFIGNPTLFNKCLPEIEGIKSGEGVVIKDVVSEDVAIKDVVVKDTEYNNTPIEPNINIPVIRKVKKLKVKDNSKDKSKDKDEVKEKKKKGALDLIKEANEKTKKDSEEYKHSIKKREESKNNPSKKAVYRKHKKKEVDEWIIEDFLGYYLNEFVEMFEMEDVDFVGLSRPKTKLLLMDMGKFRKAHFSKSNEDFKNYIKWAMEFINDPNTWINSSVSIYSITVNKLSKNLVKEYFFQKTKNKMNKNKVQKDSECAEKDYWKEKYL